MSKFHNILNLQNSVISVCEELKECLRAEKRNLIELRLDEVVQTTHSKERLHHKLKSAKEDLSHALVLYYNIESPRVLGFELEDEEEKTQWDEARLHWEEVWSETHELLETNLTFIKHSLKNLNLLGDNLKRLLGTSSIYSNQGKKVDIETDGKVVAGAY